MALALVGLFGSCQPKESDQAEPLPSVEEPKKIASEPKKDVTSEGGEEAEEKDKKDFKGEATRIRDKQKEGLENLLPYGRKRAE